MRSLIIAAALTAVSGSASAAIVYDALWNNGFYTPFNSGTPASHRYGDSGWLGSGPAVAMDSIKLGMVVFNGGSSDIPDGTLDLKFTLNDGDASGLVFGSGAQLFAKTIKSIPMPALAAGQLSVFPISIPLGGVSTLGGFNNVGFTVGVDNFNWGGSLGFQCTSGMTVGFYTNNLSFFNGTSWSQFSFSPIGQYVATIYNIVPTPGAAAMLGLAGLTGLRRRR